MGAKVTTIHGVKRLAGWFGFPGDRYLAAELPATTSKVRATTNTGKAEVANATTEWQLAEQLLCEASPGTGSHGALSTGGTTDDSQAKVTKSTGGYSTMRDTVEHEKA